jgi:two-component system LytT family response regulator
MPSMKALLIDDERLARNELRRLLAAFPEIKVAGEAANAKQAREQMAALKPDLLFLDVQMPGETGLEFLESLEPPVPHVIFTTAYDEFAVKAFELNALDYLLKPVDPARLAAAVERLPGNGRTRQPEGGSGAASTGRTRSSCGRASDAGSSRSARSASSRARATTRASTSATPSRSSSAR